MADDIGKSAKKGIAWTGVAQVSKQFLDFCVGVIIARILDPKDFGVVGSCMVVMSFVSILTSFGFATAIIQRPSLTSDFVKTAQTLSAILGGICALTIYLTAPLIGGFYKNPEVTQVISVMSLIFIITSFNMVPNALLSRNILFHKLTVVSVTGAITYGLLSVVMAVNGYGVWSIVVAQLLASLLGTVLMSIFASYRPRLGVNAVCLKELFSFGKFVTISSLLNHLARNADNLIVGRYLGAEQLGLYARAYNLATIPKEILVSVFGSVLLPSFSRKQDELEWIKNAYLKSVNAITLLSLPVGILFALTAPELVVSVYGSKWAGAALPLQLLGIAGFVYSLYIPCTSLLLALGKVKVYSKLQVLYSSALVSSVFLAYPYGLPYVAASVSIVIIIVFIAYLYVVNPLINVSFADYFNSIKIAVISCSVMALAIFGVKALVNFSYDHVGYMVLFALEVCGCVASYLLCLFLSNDLVVLEFMQALKRRAVGAPRV